MTEIFFLRHHFTTGATFEKKNAVFFSFFSKFPQILEFQMWIFGRKFGQKFLRKIFFGPIFLPKTILRKIRPLHHLKIQKVEPHPQNDHSGGGVGSYLSLIPVII